MQALVVDDPVESTIYRLALADFDVEVVTGSGQEGMHEETDVVFAGINNERDLLLVEKLRNSMPRAKIVGCVSSNMQSESTGCDATLDRGANYGDLHAAIHDIIR